LKKNRQMNCTAIIKECDEGLYGYIQEIPEARSQGKTIEELEENLKDALNVIFKDHIEESIKANKGKKIIKKTILV